LHICCGKTTGFSITVRLSDAARELEELPGLYDGVRNFAALDQCLLRSYSCFRHIRRAYDGERDLMFHTGVFFGSGEFCLSV
jgi:hypothetical protein